MSFFTQSGLQAAWLPIAGEIPQDDREKCCLLIQATLEVNEIKMNP
jgi:hypothetical protein